MPEKSLRVAVPLQGLGVCVGIRFLFHSLLLFLFLGLNFPAFSQKKFKTDPDRQKLLEAQKYRAKDPAQSIKIIENLLGGAKRKKNRAIEGEAYFLLGNIYEDVNQPELALNRYQSALSFFQRTKDPENQAKTHSVIGKLEFGFNRYSNAERSFQNCVDLTKDKTLETICLEGLADLAIRSKDFSKGQELNTKVKGNTSNFTAKDSLIVSRTLARDAEIYAEQNQIAEAEEALSNSIQNLPAQQISKEDYGRFKKISKTIKGDNSQIADASHRYDDESGYLDFANKNVLASEPVILEQLDLANQSLESGNLVAAEKYLNSAKGMDSPQISPAGKAKIAEISALIHERKGETQLALTDWISFSKFNDSVLSNKENEINRMVEILRSQGNIDLLEKDVALEETQLQVAENQIFTQKMIIGFLSLLLLTALVSFYFIMKNVRARRRANQMLYLKSLRTQMNPHFIFNALNSVNNFISKNDERAANKFLSDFSKLMRMVLDYSQKDFITLEEELNLIELYLKLEHSRFRDKFDYKFEKPEILAQPDLKVPPMLIQPFIENAIWHGLRYKNEKGNLNVSITESENQISVTVSDDGIGREKSQALKTDNQKKYKSTGLANVGKRLELVNDLYGKGFEISVKDLNSENEETGTFVEIRIPVN